MSRLAWLLILSLSLGGCALFGDEVDKTKDWSQQKLYNEATSAMANKDWEDAIEYFEKLESRYPFGKYAHQAQLNVAYAYYRAEEPESALAAADRFIKFHPQHPAAAYANYLKGLVNFNRTLGFFARYTPTDISQRDPGAAVDSYKDFETVVTQYPDSQYAEDARQRMLYLRNNLARYEVHVARYYMKRGAYLAAANRANYVVENFQRTPALQDALELMVRAYNKLDMPELAEDAQRVLTANLENGAFISDPQDLQDRGFTHSVWEFFELDR